MDKHYDVSKSKLLQSMKGENYLVEAEMLGANSKCKLYFFMKLKVAFTYS